MIDIAITSSSRPQLFPYCWESFKDMIHIRGNKKVIVHEDVVFKKESDQVVKYLRELHQKGEIQEYYSESPAIGLGRTLDWLIRQKIDSKYMFYLQEDWEFERPVDLDQLIWVMDNNPQINLIFLNKTKNFETLNNMPMKQYIYNGVDMCLYHSWTFLPGLWRMSFVKKHWRMRVERPEGYFTNAFGNHTQRMSCDYCEKNIGAYILGKQGEFRYVRHIGNDWRMAQWRLENGKPGGSHAPVMDLPFIAPWVPYPDRPVQKPNPTKEELEKLMSEEPQEIQNAKVEN